MQSNIIFGKLSQYQYNALQILWDSKEPMSLQEISDVAEKRQIVVGSRRSLFNMINTLIDRGLVMQSGLVPSTKVYARTFSPAISRVDWYAQELRSMLPAEDLAELADAISNSVAAEA